VGVIRANSKTSFGCSPIKQSAVFDGPIEKPLIYSMTNYFFTSYSDIDHISSFFTINPTGSSTAVARSLPASGSAHCSAGCAPGGTFASASLWDACVRVSIGPFDAVAVRAFEGVA